jgi:hypothetical protein
MNKSVVLSIILLLVLINTSLFASKKSEMLKLYKASKYMDACDIGYKNFASNKKDEKFITLYAFSCLKADQINRLSCPIRLLRKTKEARFNSAYFSIILMQKKLLYYAMMDNYNITSFKLPSSEYILSRVFNMYIDATKEGKTAPFNFKDKDERYSYKLYLINDNGVNKVVIDEMFDSNLVQKHSYW